jgi:hypothetical protein
VDLVQVFVVMIGSTRHFSVPLPAELRSYACSSLPPRRANQSMDDGHQPVNREATQISVTNPGEIRCGNPGASMSFPLG